MTAPEKDYVLVTEYFHPDTASTGQLMTELAVGLSECGLDIAVYTSQPNYHSGENQRQPAESHHEGVPVRRVAAPQVRQVSLARRLFNWTVFTLWMFFVLLTSRVERREVVFVSNPPFVPVAMWLLCGIKGWEYTYIVYDFYPDVVVASGHLPEGGLVHRIWSRLNGRVFRDARNVVALGPVMRERILASVDWNIDEERVRVVHNWADGERIRPKAKDENWFSQEHDLVDQFSLVYSGNIGANHDLETVVRAASAFEDDEVTFLIIGEGDEKRGVVDLANRLGLDRGTVKFLPYQDLDVLPYSLTSADVSVVSVADGMKGLCVSSKVYTALAAGQPVLLIAEEGSDEARIVRDHDAGIRVSPGDTSSVEAAIDRWMSDPELVERQGANARTAFEENYAKERSIDQYYRILSGDEVAPEPDNPT